jgi:hypothetical protein
VDASDSTKLGKTIHARLREAASARFISWLTLGDESLSEDKITAVGTIDFVGNRTRCAQRTGSAVQRTLEEKRTLSHSPVERIILTGGVWLAHRPSTNAFREYFYAEGRAWELSRGSWGSVGPAEPPPGIRAGHDSIVLLQCLEALVKVDRVHQATEPDTELEVTADLRQASEELRDFFVSDNKLAGADATNHRTPLGLWVDADGLLCRIRCAPSPPTDRSALWWTVQFDDFGTTFEPPDVNSAQQAD